ncbi:hypothetical protein [Brevundimonas sp.]|uniref:hypothetical protein n=1 Tax=Brevundimonas sp. TaxID=1871086 RepID=UPI003562A48D
MTRPDLDTDEGRAAYRRELKRVGWPLRLGGLVLIVAAAVLIVAVRQGWIADAGITDAGIATNVGYGMLALGWALFLAATFVRTRYNRRRLAEGL